MNQAVTEPVYDGPLDALLQLIEAEELAITDISLAKVTDRYLAHVETLERRHLPEISDWLVIAARLILLKSRALLAVPEDEIEETDDLAAQLIEYKQMKQLAEQLGDGLAETTPLLGGRPQKVAHDGEMVTDGVDISALEQAFAELIINLPAPKPLAEESLEPQVTLEECVASVKQRVTAGKTGFTKLFEGVKSRVTMIVTFLAVLELVKQRQLAVSGSGSNLALEARA